DVRERRSSRLGTPAGNLLLRVRGHEDSDRLIVRLQQRGRTRWLATGRIFESRSNVNRHHRFVPLPRGAREWEHTSPTTGGTATPVQRYRRVVEWKRGRGH